MRLRETFAIAVAAMSLSCAPARPKPLRRVAVRVPRHCAVAPPGLTSPQFRLLDSDPSLAAGKPTIAELQVFRKTVVVVHDHYYDPARIDPPRMLAAIVTAFAEASGGALTADGTTLVATAGGRWSANPAPDSIWQIPLTLRDLGEFLIGHLPPQHRLVRGEFAEILATNALLSTLDRASMLLTSGMLSTLQQRPATIHGASMEKQAEAFLAAPFASAMLPGDVLHLRTGLFKPETPALIRDAIEKAPVNRIAGVILDLRGNLGGMFEAVEKVIDLFMSSGTMLIQSGRDSAEVKNAGEDGLASEHLKLVVLTDSNTGSGAEMVAGALRFGDRSILVGGRTHGDGLVNVLYDFKDRESKELSVLRLTIAEALLPGDRAFDGAGIAPDLEVLAATEQGAAPVQGCAPVGQTLATLRFDPAESDPALAVAARVLTTSQTAARADLLAAAKSVAASAPRANR